MLAVDIVLTGLIIGGIYALTALGLTLQYGVARIMNLSYGEFVVGAALTTHWLYTVQAVSPLVGLIVIVPLAFALSWLMYQIVLQPLVRRAKNEGMLEVDSILATFGLLFVMQGVALVVFGGHYFSYSYLSIPFSVFGSALAVNRLIALGFAAVIGCAIYLALTRTRAGTAIRAVAVALALGGALVAAAGVLVSMFLTFDAAMGVGFTMKALIVVIMGGVGNMLGALIAGLLLGIGETAVARLIDPGLTLAASYALFLAVLLIRPTGLFGRPAR